jgi:hypothetical protein
MAEFQSADHAGYECQTEHNDDDIGCGRFDADALDDRCNEKDAEDGC